VTPCGYHLSVGKPTWKIFHPFFVHDVADDLALNVACLMATKKLVDVACKDADVIVFGNNLLGHLKNVGMFLQTSM